MLSVLRILFFVCAEKQDTYLSICDFLNQESKTLFFTKLKAKSYANLCMAQKEKRK
jgi:hypothetical protein